MSISKKTIFLGLVLVLCIGGIVAIHIRVLAARSDIALRQQQLDAAPEESQKTSRLKKQLQVGQTIIQGLQGMLISRDNLPDVVSAISQTALASHVAADVPQLAQNTTKGSPVSDPLDDVRIHISASGDTSALIVFLYRIEQLPYLMHIASWRIDATHQVSLPFLSASAPTNQPLPPPAQGSSLEADVVISIKK